MNLAIRMELRPLKRVFRLAPILALAATACNPSLETAVLSQNYTGCVTGEKLIASMASADGSIPPLRHQLKVYLPRIDRRIILESAGDFAQQKDQELDTGNTMELHVELKQTYNAGDQISYTAAQNDLDYRLKRMLLRDKITLDETGTKNRVRRIPGGNCSLA